MIMMNGSSEFIIQRNLAYDFYEFGVKNICEPSCLSVTCIINLSSDSLTFYSFVEFLNSYTLLCITANNWENSSLYYLTLIPYDVT